MRVLKAILIPVLALPAQAADCSAALEAHRHGQFEQALAAYPACVHAEPQNFLALSNFGAALAHEGRYAEAIEQDRAALLIVPPEAIAPLRMNLALAYYKSAQILAAVAEFETLHADEPANRKAALLLADCRLHLGQPKSAISLLAPLSAATPDDRTVNYLLGSAYLQAGDSTSAQSYLDKILRDGDSAEGRLLLGTGMMQAGNYPAAVQEFARAASINPALPSVHSFHGQALLRTGDPDGASEAFRRELLQQPADFEANLQLAQILLTRKQFSGVGALLERALQLRPTSEEARATYAGLQQALAGKPPLTSPLPVAGGPYVGSQAPEFALPQLSSSTTVSLKQLRSSKPVLLVFGSYTCPQLRAASAFLNKLYPIHDQVSFVLVYIKEAHATGSWQSTINAREGIELPLATTPAEKRAAAAQCIRKLHIPYQALVDTMDGSTEKAYDAWPSRIFLIDRKGTVTFQSRLNELEFSREALNRALQDAHNLAGSDARHD